MTRFKVVAIEETEYWDTDFLEDCNVAHAFGLYIFKPGERTHICSLTPNSRVDFLENVFLPEDPTLEMDVDVHTPCDTEYHGFIDVKKRDPRFLASTRIQGWRNAQTLWRESPSYPAILDPAVYQQYQHEQRLKRLATNTPPLSGRDQLPLFLHPARQIFEAHSPGPDAPYDALRAADQALQQTFRALHWR